MTVRFARPDVSGLMFHVYGRSIHPELVATLAECQLSLSRFSATIRIGEAGHLIEVRHGESTLTEVAAASGHPLPTRRRLLERRLRGCRDEGFRLDSGLKYQVSYQLERVDPEVFQNLHEEILADCARAELSFRFPSASRLSPEPISLVRVEATPRSLLVHAFHTFPESMAVVKTQSLFEI